METDDKAEACAVSLEALDERNAEQHAHICNRMDQIENKLDKSMIFQSRLRWVGGTAVLIIGGLIGWLAHIVPWLWKVLPPHDHTH